MAFLGIDRDIENHWIYQDAEYFKVWFEILLRARFSQEPEKKLMEGKLVTIEYGQFLYGRVSWSSRLKVSEQRLRTLFKKLVDDGMIELIQTFPKFSLYSVKNYAKYNQQSNHQQIHTGQGNSVYGNHQINSESTSSQPAANQQPTTQEQSSNKENKVNKERRSSSRKQAYDESHVAYRSARYLYEQILTHSPEVKKPDLQSWADEMRKLIEIDRREPIHIARVIEWVVRDTFWHSNILSAKKLREKWDMLVAQMNRGEGNAKYGRNDRGHTEADRQAAQRDQDLPNIIRPDYDKLSEM